MSLTAAGGTFPPTPTGKADRGSSRERNHREEETTGRLLRCRRGLKNMHKEALGPEIGKNLLQLAKS